jgi:hypothetical protein
VTSNGLVSNVIVVKTCMVLRNERVHLGNFSVVIVLLRHHSSLSSERARNVKDNAG